MPAWYTSSSWVLGELASEDDGSLRPAAMVELYLHGRNDFANGLLANSPARTFAEAAEAAVARVHADHTGNAAAFLAMPEAVRVAKFWEHIAGCQWPKQLDLWRGGAHGLQSDVYDLFVYTESRGAGATAERILLGKALRTRAVLSQMHPLSGVLGGCADFPYLVSALRALCSSVNRAGTPVALNDLLAVNQALNSALPHCSGAEFIAKPFEERVAKAKELCERSHAHNQYAAHGMLPALGVFGDQSGASASSAAKAAGKFDRSRLEAAKNSEDYNVGKRQILTAFNTGDPDKATLIALRGADSPIASAPGMPPVRLHPHKVFSNLVLGKLETWAVDKDLDAPMAELRRGMDQFWGRRAAKHLQLDLEKAGPLYELSASMANPAGWANDPPDFYKALVAARVADGDVEADVHASFGFTPGSDPWANPQIVTNLGVMVVGLMSDIGVCPHARVHDFKAVKPGDLYSTQDMFAYLAWTHSRLGGLSTTAAKLSEFARGLLKDFGFDRGTALSSSDATRALGDRFIALSSTRVQDFVRFTNEQLEGRKIQAQLRAAGIPMGLHIGMPGLSDVGTTATKAKRERTDPDFVSEVQKEVRKQLKSAGALSTTVNPKAGANGGKGNSGAEQLEDFPPVKIVLLDGGKRVHVTGGRRGPDGCFYLVDGPNGMAHRLKHAKSSIGPVFLLATRSGVEKDDIQAICAKSPWPGDDKIPDEIPAELGSDIVKISDFRINEDGSQYLSRISKGAGAGGRSGRGAGGRGRGGGRGSAALVAANLAGGTSLMVHGSPRADVVMADAVALPAASLTALAAPARAAISSKLGAGGTKIFEVAAELRRLEAAADRQTARRAAGKPLCDWDEVAASHEASRGPALRRQLRALTGGRDLSAGSTGFETYLRSSRAPPTVTFAPGTPPSGPGTAFGVSGVWAARVGTLPARGGLQQPPIFRFDRDVGPTLATLVVPVRTDTASGLVLKPMGDALLGEAMADEPSRDAAVNTSQPIAVAVLGDDAEFSVYLAGEWVDDGHRFRVVLCIVGGPLRADMASALRDGSAACRTCRWASWWRATELAGSRAGDIALAALARARLAVRPDVALDARLHIGRGEQRWVATSQEAATASRPLLGESLALADSTALSAGTCDRGQRTGVIERVKQAHDEVQQLLLNEAASRRSQGDDPLAAFLEGCASRVEPVPLHEIPKGLAASALAKEDIDDLTRRPFSRNTFVTETAKPVYKARPTEFPAHLPKPTGHSSFLKQEVMEVCHKWYDDANKWHRLRIAGVDAPRPKGVAFGFDAVREGWQPFFEAGGVVIFDKDTGEPRCLTEKNYPLRSSLNGTFAALEFADYPDQEMVAAICEGVCIKAQGLPILQLACNLEALYTADGVTGVRGVAAELDRFSAHDGGWLLAAPPADRQRGLLPTATLPACVSPIGAVAKKDGGTRVVNDMGYPYGKLALHTVKESPRPPHHLWDGTSPYRPSGPRPHESAITLGGGGATALPPNVASGPSKPPKGESYQPNGQWPWMREGKCTVAEQAVNDTILSVPSQLTGLPIFHLLWDCWKCFHQSHYRPFEVTATAVLVPCLNGAGEVEDHLRGKTNGRMAMGGLFASGICQREGNGIYFKTMQRFDARQQTRRLTEPESPAVVKWLTAREALAQDDYGTQARLAVGGFYSDDPKFSVLGPASRVLDLALSFFEVVGPNGLAFKLAEHTKWQVSCWAAWQGVRMSAMLGILWLPPDKALRASKELQEYSAGRMLGAGFVKMMGFLNYLAEVLVVHANLNRMLWLSYDEHQLGCRASDVGANVVHPGPPQQRAVAAWRTIIMRSPGTTLLRVVRRVPPPSDNVTVWALASDACMDTVVVDGVKVAGCLHGGVNSKGQPMHDPPGMGGVLYGRLWQYPFTADEIEVVTIPVAEFMAAVVGLLVYDGVGSLEHAERICLEVDAEATPRTAMQGEAHRPGLLVAHDEFMRLPAYDKYKTRLTGQHVFGAGNEGADKASRSRNADAERLVRFLGLEPRWLPVPPEALDYVTAVVTRLRDLQKSKRSPGTCDPAEPGGDAPRFGGTPSPPIAPRQHIVHSPAAVSVARAQAASSPALLVAARRAGSPYSVPDDAETPRPPTVRPGLSPPIMRTFTLPPSPPLVGGLGPRAGPSMAPMAAARIAATRSATSSGAASLPSTMERVGGEQQTSFVVAERIDALMDTNQRNSSRPHAFRGDQEHLRALLNSSLRAQADAANENSLAAEETHERLYWRPYCETQKTSTVRPDVRSLGWDEIQLEEAWWAGAIPFVQKLMPNQQGVVGAALPQSILKVVQNIRRAHARMHIQTVSLAPCVRATDGLLKDFVLEHGPLALIPKRKEPLTNEEIARIFAHAGPIGRSRSPKVLDWRSPEYSSLLAMFHTLAQTGMRKGEVSLPANARFDKSRLSMLNVRWSIGGVVYDELTPSLYERLRVEGGYALLRPPPSKADPFSLHWGPCTIYLRFDATETINAARELAREELRRQVPLVERESAPLFVNADGGAWRHAALAKIFDDIVVAVCGAARAKQVSMHSWRVYLACALLAKGASFATIQTMLRWRSEDALRIYARINNFVYADWLSSVQGASVSSIRTTTGAVGQLAGPPEPGTLAGAVREAAAMQAAREGGVGAPIAGFQQEWMRQAAQAVDSAVRGAHAQEVQPEIDAYDRVTTLSHSMTALILAAQRADAEDEL